MLSFETPGSARHATNLRTVLTTAVTRGLMTPADVQVVWDMFLRADARGGRHLQDAAAAWRTLLERVRTAASPLPAALTSWQTFLSSGVLPPTHAFLAPHAYSPVRPQYSAGALDIPQRSATLAAFSDRNGNDRLRRLASVDDPGRFIDAGRFVEICPCCVRSKAEIDTIEPGWHDNWDRLNRMKFGVTFSVGLSPLVFRPSPAMTSRVIDCELEWWECPSRAYVAAPGWFVPADQWTNLTPVFLKTSGARDWNQLPAKLKALCDKGDSRTTIPIVLEDTPAIADTRNYRRYLNIEVRIKSGTSEQECQKPNIVARIRVEQSNDRNGKPNRGRAIDLGRTGKYLTLDYSESESGEKKELKPGIAAGPR